MTAPQGAVLVSRNGHSLASYLDAGTPLGYRNLTRRGFETARDKAGLPEELTLRDLRDYAASKWINLGVPATKVARWLGHKDAGITFNKYARDFEEKQSDRDALRLIEGSAS